MGILSEVEKEEKMAKLKAQERNIEPHEVLIYSVHLILLCLSNRL